MGKEFIQIKNKTSSANISFGDFIILMAFRHYGVVPLWIKDAEFFIKGKKIDLKTEDQQKKG